MPDRESDTPTPEPLRMPENEADLRQMLVRAAQDGATTVTNMMQGVLQTAGNLGDMEKSGIELGQEDVRIVFDEAVKAADTVQPLHDAIMQNRVELVPNPLTPGRKILREIPGTSPRSQNPEGTTPPPNVRP